MLKTAAPVVHLTRRHEAAETFQLPPPLLELRSVSKNYGALNVLRNVNLRVESNEFLAVLGPSGSGKTTILRVIGGFEATDGGQVLVDGHDLGGVPINRRPFNTVFQDYALFHHMRVRDNVGYGLRVRGTDRAATAKRVEEVLDIVGLHAMGERYPAQLSGGQRQRVALARAIICEPRIILLDEPLAALDVSLRAQMQRFLKDIQRRLGITFLFVTHDQEEAIVLADRIVVVRDGAIEQVGPAEELYDHPRTPFVAGFFGENNLLDGRIRAHQGDKVIVDTALGPVAATSRREAVAVDDVVLLAVRPERVAVATDLTQAATACNRVRAQVVESRYLGASRMIELRPEPAPDICLRMRMLAGERPLSLGDWITVAWSDDDVTTIPAAPRHD